MYIKNSPLGEGEAEIVYVCVREKVTWMVYRGVMASREDTRRSRAMTLVPHRMLLLPALSRARATLLRYSPLGDWEIVG